METKIFSADSHIVEPRTLFLDRLPANLHAHAPNVSRDGDLLLMRVGETVMHKQRLPQAGKEGEDIGRTLRKGASNLVGRLEDMELEGITAELIFPTVGLIVYFVQDREASLASCQAYNDWCFEFFAGHRDRFVPAAILPPLDIQDAIVELRRIVPLGFTAAMLPVIMTSQPAYNEEAWDPLFAAAAELGIVLTFHTGTGDRPWVSERRAGAAVINYTTQMTEAVDTCMRLVAGGVLDRNPDAKVCFVESGASWLAALSERMDEVYEAHHHYVRPKLSLKPSEIVRRQVSCAFQHDRACIMSRGVTGLDSLLWATDYPHAEGTFPNSRKVAAELFDGIEISSEEKAAILGGNGFKLFRPHPSEPTARSLAA